MSKKHVNLSTASAHIEERKLYKHFFFSCYGVMNISFFISPGGRESNFICNV
jgi:hypothetical protein